MGRTLRGGCRTAAGAVLALVLLSACASTPPGRISTETTPTADFSARHTFGWQDSQASLDTRAPEQEVEAVKQTIHRAVVEQLEQKGFREAADATPDFLVSFHLVVTVTSAPELCLRRNMIFEWPPRSAGREELQVCERETLNNNRKVRRGALVVFVVDPANHSLLWQGIADGAAVAQRDNSDSLRDAVIRMFAEFPPV